MFRIFSVSSPGCIPKVVLFWNATYHPNDIVDNSQGTDTGFGTLSIEYLF